MPLLILNRNEMPRNLCTFVLLQFYLHTVIHSSEPPTPYLRTITTEHMRIFYDMHDEILTTRYNK